MMYVKRRRSCRQNGSRAGSCRHDRRLLRRRLQTIDENNDGVWRREEGMNTRANTIS